MVNPWTNDELHQRQFDILWKAIADNPLLQNHPIPILNRGLDTNSKSIILAINEVLRAAQSSQVAVDAFKSRFEEVIGDELRNPELLEQLKSIDGNLLSSIYKIYLEIVGDPNEPTDISEIGPSVKAAIKELDIKLKLQNKLLEFTNYIEELSINQDNPHEFELSFIPQNESLVLYINGIGYKSDDFKLDRLNKKIKWTFNSENNGFDILDDFEVKAKYDFYYWENNILDPERFARYIEKNKKWVPRVSLVSDNIPEAIINQEYEGHIFLAINGVPPYNFKVTNGKLPEGLILTPEGEIKGTPTEYGDFNFTITVEDSEDVKSNIDSLEFSMKVSILPISIDTETLPLAKNNVEYSYNLLVSGGVPPYTFNVEENSVLPDGLTLSNDGLISGKPTIDGIFNLDIRVSDSIGNFIIENFQLKIEVRDLEILTSSLNNGFIGEEYLQFQFSVIGGKQPYSFSISKGSLPSGLILSKNGILNGMPEIEGQYKFTLSVKDVDGRVIEKEFVFHIIEADNTLRDEISGGIIVDEINNIVQFGNLYIDSIAHKIPSNPYNSVDGDLIPKPSVFTIGDTINQSDEFKLRWIKGEYNNKKIYICDRNLINYVSYNDLNSIGYTSGVNVTIDGVNYLLRIITGGILSFNKNNEWDQVLIKTNPSNLFHHGSVDKPTATWSSEGKKRGENSFNSWANAVASLADASTCWRPVLEVIE